MNAKNHIIHFCHIPKSGGTSFRRGLESAYGEKVCFYYRNPIKLKHRVTNRIIYRYFQVKSKFFPEYCLGNYDVVYGHFCFDDVYAPPHAMIKRGVFFRDPIEWVGSFYFYFCKKFPNEISRSPIELIRKLNMSKSFRRYLGQFEVEDMDFVGLQEEYQNSLALFEKIFHKKIPQYHERKTQDAPKSYKQYFLEKGQLDEIQALMHDNNVIYSQALKKYKQLCRVGKF